MALGSQLLLSDMENDSIMVFSRVPADGFDAFINDGGLVIATVEDMGFDQDEMMAMLSHQGGDPGALYNLMEGRWSGEEPNFSFEKLWPLLREKLGDAGAKVLDLIEKEGRDSQIDTDVGAIRVLSPAQVAQAADGLAGLTVETEAGNEDEESLEMLFPALQKFFRMAADDGEFVLVSQI